MRVALSQYSIQVGGCSSVAVFMCTLRASERDRQSESACITKHSYLRQHSSHVKVLLEATTQIHCSGPRAILLAAHRLPLCLGRIGGGERLETLVPAVGVELLEQLEQDVVQSRASVEFV